MDPDKIEAKLDKIIDTQTGMLVVAERHESTLQEHMRRTAVIEDRYEKDIPELREHMTASKTVTKVAAVVGAALGVMTGLAELYLHWKG